ncbi:sodium:proton antiporter [Pseudobdellovibrio exovorus]|uniref:Multisubunit Na+/H+ antiporter n=1 Tax=Pseudobdellovibrio exovorus JSS TaxID=1184267 RepID=M4V5C6_9BACT|nr:NADH-quinone oxidoreductase subunit K [Pseudobdellovibrio exovorus]AGH94388.1 multisubunit Na+/H+ antiporter [Pseudobdellovibrio exovorus JSS]
MISILSLACGVLAAAGTYLLLRRRLFDFLIGVTLIGHAVNLAIFVASNSQSKAAPIMNSGQMVLPTVAMDPVPQALILTAIVISFGTMALLAVLVRTSLKKSNLQMLDEVKTIKKGVS